MREAFHRHLVHEQLEQAVPTMKAQRVDVADLKPGGAYHMALIFDEQRAAKVLLPKSFYAQESSRLERKSDPPSLKKMRDRVSNTLQWLRDQDKAASHKVNGDNQRAYWGPLDGVSKNGAIAQGWTIAETMELPT